MLSALPIIQQLIAYVLQRLAKAGTQIGKAAANDVWTIVKRLGDILNDTVQGHLTTDEAKILGQEQITMLSIALQSAISEVKVAAEQIPSDLTNGLESIFLGALKLL